MPLHDLPVQFLPLLLAALAVGAILGWLLARLKYSSATSIDLAALNARLEERDSQTTSLKAELERGSKEIADLREANARLSTGLEAERRSVDEKLVLLRDADAALREAFKSLSADALQHNNQSFLDLARTSLGEFNAGAQSDLQKRQLAIEQLVTPIRESLQGVATKIQQVELDREGAYKALREQVGSLLSAQQQLQGETGKLVQALRSPTVRGQWGEIQLKRVVEMAGMMAHCDFREQTTVTTDVGRLRPDVVVMLPGGKQVIVDAKAPLDAYLRAVEAPDEAGRQARLLEHAAQVRTHIAKLANKSYWD